MNKKHFFWEVAGTKENRSRPIQTQSGAHPLLSYPTGLDTDSFFSLFILSY